MKNVKIKIAYDGGNYIGWQKQGKDDSNRKTIQEVIEKTLSNFLKEKIEIIGSGRTDKGVHAMGQVANFKTKSKISLGELQSEVNEMLPNDIVIRRIEKMGEDFHSRYKAVGKVYAYKIYNDDKINPFKRKHYYFKKEKLNIEAMEKGANLLIGEHDFIGFSSVKKGNKSTVRKIEKIEIIKNDKDVEIYIHGNGFLYNMARIIVGTLVEVGEGSRNINTITSILEGKERSMAGRTIPPHGLYLQKVIY